MSRWSPHPYNPSPRSTRWAGWKGGLWRGWPWAMTLVPMCCRSLFDVANQRASCSRTREVRPGLSASCPGTAAATRAEPAGASSRLHLAHHHHVPRWPSALAVEQQPRTGHGGGRAGEPTTGRGPRARVGHSPGEQKLRTRPVSYRQDHPGRQPFPPSFRTTEPGATLATSSGHTDGARWQNPSDLVGDSYTMPSAGKLVRPVASIFRMMSKRRDKTSRPGSSWMPAKSGCQNWATNTSDGPGAAQA